MADGFEVLASMFLLVISIFGYQWISNNYIPLRVELDGLKPSSVRASSRSMEADDITDRSSAATVYIQPK